MFELLENCKFFFLVLLSFIFKPMFKFLLEYKASLHIKNRQNLTPLTLAAKLARKEVTLIRTFKCICNTNLTSYCVFVCKDVWIHSRATEISLVHLFRYIVWLISVRDYWHRVRGRHNGYRERHIPNSQRSWSSFFFFLSIFHWFI